MTPTARSLDLLRHEGFIAAPVERWLAHPGVRVDVWGFGDILAAHPTARVVLIVQATTADHTAHRLNKARACPELAAWLRAGGAFEVHGWARRGSRWHVRRLTVENESLQPVPLALLPRRRRPRRGERQGMLPGFEVHEGSGPAQRD